MYRWSQCAGSVRECAKVKNKTSSRFADEGSDAHALASYCFAWDTQPTAYVGKRIKHDNREFDITQDMADAVQVYTDHVRNNRQYGDVNLLEHKFDLSKIYPGCFGTADYVTYRPKDKLLIVRDYKHGAGVYVPVYENKQLQYYALGALMTCSEGSGWDVDRVRMEIIQPRCEGSDGPVRSWEIDASDLLDFAVDLRAAAVATEEPDAKLTPGDHCKFCAAAATCPALADRSQAIARVEFEPVAANFDAAKLGATLDTLDALEARIKAIRQFAYERAQAGDRIPGWKLVAKRATRKWRDDVQDADLYEAAGQATEIYAPREFKSPAQLEKAAGKGKFDHLIIAESSGQVLVPDSDKRAAVSLAPSQTFEKVTVAAGTIFD